MRKTRLEDKRVKKVVVFDTETAPYYEKLEVPKKVTGVKEKPTNFLVYGDSLEEYLYNGKVYYRYLTNRTQLQLIFDFGYTIADKQGNIFIKRNYLVKEIFTDMKLMRNAYYFEKYPMYLEMLNNNEVKLAPWSTIITQLEKDMLDYNIHEAYAFNIAFDKTALCNTHRIITGRQFLFWDFNGTKANCLWGMCAETIMSTKGFIRTALEQNWLTESGNIKTNAEVGYRYLTSCYDFEESHTALDDAIIETLIMARCFKSHKKMTFGILPNPWKIVKNKAEEYQLKGIL